MSSGSDSSAPQKPSGPPKRRLRNYLLQAAFQIKYTIVIVVIAVLIAGGMGFWVLAAFDANLRSTEQMGTLSTTLTDLSKENSRLLLADALFEMPAEMVTTLEERNALAEAKADEIGAKHAEQVVAVRENTVRVKYYLIAMLLSLVVLLTLFGIFITHRVAGPIFVMTRLFQKVTRGDFSQSARNLRDRDELKDFFIAYKDMISALRRNLREDIEQLELALAELPAGTEVPVPERAMDALRKMKAEKESALGNAGRTPSLTNIPAATRT